MKKLLVSLFVLAALLVGGTVLVANLMPKERIESEVKSRVKEAIGREVEFSKAQLMVWPTPGIRLRQVTLKNPAWAKAEHLLTLDKLEIFLGLKKLLEKKIEVRHFVLTKPILALEVSANGQRSWDFKQPEKEKRAEASGTGVDVADFQFTFGQMQLKEGTVSFFDHAAQQKKTADQIDVSVTYPDLQSSLEVDGALQYGAKKINLVFSVEKPRDLFAGKASKLRARVKAEGASLELTGASSLKDVLFDGDVTGEYDALKAKGALKITNAARPHVAARLAMNKLAIDSFLKTSSATEAKESAAPPSGWSEDKIDFSALRALDADLELKTDGFSWRGVDVGPSVLSVLLKDGNLSFKSSEAALFGGRFTSAATVATSAPPRLSFDFEMKGVEAKPLLSNFANFKKLSGTVEGNIRGAAAGQSEKEIISSLNGAGAAVFRNGAFEGIDLAKIARLLQAKSENVGATGEGQTEFVELGGTFTIQNGAATNNDLKMIGPLVNATGKGKVDLPQKHVQYRVLPVLLESRDSEKPSGISIPVDIAGPFDDIKIRPDFASVIGDVITDPSKAKQSIKNIKGNIKDIEKDLRENPAKALEGLLGGGL